MSRVSSLALVLAIAAPGLAQAQTNVFLDFTNFDARLNEATTAAGITQLTATERSNLRNGIQNQLQSIYAAYTVNFTPNTPGGNYERLRFGETTTTAGLFGLADRIDWRNQSKNDVARIYTRNFSGFMSSSNSRATNLQRLENSLARTAAHELGHNVGLQHYDCYGYGRCTHEQNHQTDGEQNRYFMGTGQTGATSFDRYTYAGVNDLMNVKLEYADGLSPSLGLTIQEGTFNNNSIANAQALTFGQLTVSNLPAVNVEGSITANDVDIFSFQSIAGSLITANVLANDIGLAGAANLDSFLTLYDANGTTLFTNDDIDFSGNKVYGTNGGYGLDSLILNYVAQTTGTYYIGIRGFNASAVGNYNLLVTPVPEPATLAALGLGAAALLRRRRRNG